MNFYKDRFGKWHDEKSFWNMASIFQPCFEDKFINDLEKGCDEEFLSIICPEIKVFKNKPTIIDYLLMNMHFEAIKRYCELHDCTLMEARKW